MDSGSPILTCKQHLPATNDYQDYRSLIAGTFHFPLDHARSFRKGSCYTNALAATLAFNKKCEVSQAIFAFCAGKGK